MCQYCMCSQILVKLQLDCCLTTNVGLLLRCELNCFVLSVRKLLAIMKYNIVEFAIRHTLRFEEQHNSCA